MSTALTRLPGGDPLSAAFPAQLDALRNALNIQGVVHAWPTMAARADDYAATGVLLAHSVFVLDDDPSAVYVTVRPWRTGRELKKVCRGPQSRSSSTGVSSGASRT